MPRISTPAGLSTPAAKPFFFWRRLKSWFARGGRDAAAESASPRDSRLAEAGAKAGVGADDGSTGREAAGASRRLPRFSDYALRHVIARNDRTTVYQATEHATGRLVAIKTVRLGHGVGAERGIWRERFLRESAASARLKHDSIVRVYAGGVQGEGEALTGWLAMEWVHGTDLSRYATPARLLPEAMVLEIGQRVASALDFAHREGIVHRDIKPSNVLFDPSTGAVKVSDFGSARVADAAATRSGLILGTPAYMAPEQLAGAEVTARSDLYALGVLLFELLVGRRPFESASMGELLAHIAREAPPRLRVLRPDLPPLVDDIVARLLAKSPEARQQSGAQVALELRLACAQCGVEEPDDVAPEWADTMPAPNWPETPEQAPEAPEIQGTIVDRTRERPEDKNRRRIHLPS